LADAGLKASDVLDEIAHIAFSRAKDFFTEGGQLIEPHQLPPRADAAMSGFEMVRKNVAAGDGHTDTVLKIKRWDKLEALEKLGNRFGLWEEKVHVDGRLEVAWLK
jgi:hypothetical protein